MDQNKKKHDSDLRCLRKRGVWMEKSTKNCWQSWIFHKSPAHKIMICVIALQMQWQAKANLWWQVTNTKDWHFKSAVSKEKKGNYYTVTTSNYSPKLLMFPYLKITSQWNGNFQPDPPIRSPADRVLFMVFGTNQLVDQSLVGALETSGIYKLFQRFT